MDYQSFGKLLKSLRAERRLSLRMFCQISGLDPGNVSRWERGVTPPPQTDETLDRIASAIGLTPGSDKYKDSFVSASISAGRIPRDTLTNRALIDRLPVFLRTLDGSKLSGDQLDALIQKINEEGNAYEK